MIRRIFTKKQTEEMLKNERVVLFKEVCDVY